MNRHRQLLGVALLGALFAGCLPASRISTRPRAQAASNGGAVRAVEQSVADPAIGYDRRAVLREAERWIGTPYQFGGSGSPGIDCSAFVQRAYDAANLKLPRNSNDQAQVGERIPLDESSPGDLVFFNTLGSGVSHVGILIGLDQFIHASTSNGVTVSSLSESYYHDRMLFVRRVLR
jgi:cell wall-associated NlpC family hydrolase